MRSLLPACLFSCFLALPVYAQEPDTSLTAKSFSEMHKYSQALIAEFPVVHYTRTAGSSGLTELTYSLTRTDALELAPRLSVYLATPGSSFGWDKSRNTITLRLTPSNARLAHEWIASEEMGLPNYQSPMMLMKIMETIDRRLNRQPRIRR